MDGALVIDFSVHLTKLNYKHKSTSFIWKTYKRPRPRHLILFEQMSNRWPSVVVQRSQGQVCSPEGLRML